MLHVICWTIIIDIQWQRHSRPLPKWKEDLEKREKPQEAREFYRKDELRKSERKRPNV